MFANFSGLKRADTGEVSLLKGSVYSVVKSCSAVNICFASNEEDGEKKEKKECQLSNIVSFWTEMFTAGPELVQLNI